MTEERKPSEIPYLHVRETEGALFPFAIEIRGNRKALLQLRQQIDRELEDVGSFPFDDTLYRELDGEEYEVVVRRARKPEEMRPHPLRVERRVERLPWADKALETERWRGEQ